LPVDLIPFCIRPESGIDLNFDDAEFFYERGNALDLKIFPKQMEVVGALI